MTRARTLKGRKARCGPNFTPLGSPTSLRLLCSIRWTFSLRAYLKDAFPDASLVSAATGEGVVGLRDRFEETLRGMGEEAVHEMTERRHRVYRPTWKGVRVEQENGGYVVSGEGVERLALKTDWGNQEGVERFQNELEKAGIVGALRRAGAEPGDEVRIGETVFDFQ